jgi:hypothetical protein
MTKALIEGTVTKLVVREPARDGGRGVCKPCGCRQHLQTRGLRCGYDRLAKTVKEIPGELLVSYSEAFEDAPDSDGASRIVDYIEGRAKPLRPVKD